MCKVSSPVISQLLDRTLQDCILSHEESCYYCFYVFLLVDSVTQKLTSEFLWSHRPSMLLSESSLNIRNSKRRTVRWWLSCLTGNWELSSVSTGKKRHLVMRNQMSSPSTTFTNTWAQGNVKRCWTNPRSSSSRPAEEVKLVYSYMYRYKTNNKHENRFIEESCL